MMFANAPWRTPVLAALLVTAACHSPEAGDEAPSPNASTETVGVYDGRAVAIAYANSEQFGAWVGDLRERRKQALAAGETRRAEQLEGEAKAQQERFHGFRRCLSCIT